MRVHSVEFGTIEQNPVHGVRIGLQCDEIAIEGSCLRLTDSNKGASVRSIGLPVLEYLESRRNEEQSAGGEIFPCWEDDTIRSLAQTVDEAVQGHRSGRDTVR